MSMISWQLWEQKSSSKRLSIQIFPMISFCLSNTTSQPSKCIRICWLCTQLMHATRKLFQLKTSTPSLIQWSHCFWRNSQRSKVLSAPSSDLVGDFQWPPKEEEFIVTLQEDGWTLGSVLSCQGGDEKISVQSLSPLKTRAKDDEGKTYWIYPAEDYVDDYEKKHVLEIRPSVSLAKNIKRKDLVFALLNREIIKALAQKLFAPTLESSVGEHAGWLFLVAGYLTVKVLVRQSVCWSIGILFAYCHFWHFASSFSITAPAQPLATAFYLNIT